MKLTPDEAKFVAMLINEGGAAIPDTEENRQTIEQLKKRLGIKIEGPKRIEALDVIHYTERKRG